MKLFFLDENSVICVNKILGVTRIEENLYCFLWRKRKFNL